DHHLRDAIVLEQIDCPCPAIIEAAAAVRHDASREKVRSIINGDSPATAAAASNHAPSASVRRNATRAQDRTSHQPDTAAGAPATTAHTGSWSGTPRLVSHPIQNQRAS